MNSVHVLCSLVTIQSWTRVIENNNDDMWALNVEKEKRKFQKWQKDCHKFVRPHILKGDVLCMAHNPSCSGTLNMVKILEKWTWEWNNVEKYKDYCQNTKYMKNKIPLHGFLKSLKIKYLLLFYQNMFYQISPCLTGVSALEIQNLPHWKW